MLAPRIHGELLKLGITVSERTVSRYLPHRLAAPSQTWRTFLANHLDTLTFSWAVMSADAASDDIIEADALPFRWAMSSVDPAEHVQSLGRYRRGSCATLQPSSLAGTQAHRHDMTGAGCSSARDPPHDWAVTRGDTFAGRMLMLGRNAYCGRLFVPIPYWPKDKQLKGLVRRAVTHDSAVAGLSVCDHVCRPIFTGGRNFGGHSGPFRVSFR